MLPQYWRLYLLTLVLGVGGSFQYGLHISVITFPAEVVWEEPCDTQIRVSVNKKIWITELLTVFAAHSKICEPHVDAEVRGAAVWFQQPAHLVLHLGCVEPGGLAGGHSWWQTSCRLWAVRQRPEHTLTHTHMYIHSDKLLINSNRLMIILLACAVHICTKSVVLYCQTWVFCCFFSRKKTLLFNNVVAIVAALLMIFSRLAKSFEMIFLARFLYGYNIGMSK